MRKLLLLTALCLLGSSLACNGAGGVPLAAPGTLLRKIQDRGSLIVGVKFDQPTFGYLNPQTNSVEGFDAAVAHEIAGYIFGDARKVVFKEAQSKDRIPFLKDGTVDLVLATMTINDDRLKDIDFSAVYYVAGQRLLVSHESSLTSIADTDGKKIGTARGSTSAANLAQFPGAQVVLFDGYADAVKALIAGQLDAISTDDTILYGFAYQNPALQVVGAQFSYEPYGAGVQKNQPDLLAVVNNVVKNLKASGKWKTIWKSEIGDKLRILSLPDPPADDWHKQVLAP